VSFLVGLVYVNFVELLIIRIVHRAAFRINLLGGFGEQMFAMCFKLIILIMHEFRTIQVKGGYSFTSKIWLQH
jgi:hypothetical protein